MDSQYRPDRGVKHLNDLDYFSLHKRQSTHVYRPVNSRPESQKHNSRHGEETETDMCRQTEDNSQCHRNTIHSMEKRQIPYFTDYKALRIIRRTPDIFKKIRKKTYKRRSIL